MYCSYTSDRSPPVYRHHLCTSQYTQVVFTTHITIFCRYNWIRDFRWCINNICVCRDIHRWCLRLTLVYLLLICTTHIYYSNVLLMYLKSICIVNTRIWVVNTNCTPPKLTLLLRFYYYDVVSQQSCNRGAKQICGSSVAAHTLLRFYYCDLYVSQHSRHSQSCHRLRSCMSSKYE